MLIVVLLLGAFTQELVLRGYLISRLRQLGFGVVPTLLVSSFLFASFHVFQGAAAPVTHFLGGLILGGVFLATGRLWPVVVAHTLHNVLTHLFGVAGATAASQNLF